MKKLLAILLAVSLIGVGAIANAQSTLVKKFDVDTMIELAQEVLDDNDFDAVVEEGDDESGDIVFEIGDWKVNFFTYADEDSGENYFMMQAIKDAEKHEDELGCNQWNWDNHFGRCYYNGDEETIVLEMDVELEGGISKTNLKRQILRFVTMVDEFEIPELFMNNTLGEWRRAS